MLASPLLSLPVMLSHAQTGRVVRSTSYTIVVGVFALALSSGLVGCGHHGAPVKVKETKGPDGSADWKQITCKRMDKKCFQAARAICPNGYVFTDGRPAEKGEAKTQALPPQEQWSDSMYSKKPGKLLIRCTDHAIDI